VFEKEYRLRSGERVYVLPPGEVLIGRDPGCQIQLDGDLVSRRPARLLIRGAEVVFEDLGSSNGSFVNEMRVEEALPLREGDRIRIGLTLLEVETAERHRRATPTLRLIHCDACGAVMTHDMGFCVQCGHRLKHPGVPRCRRCQTIIPPGDRFCPSCGTKADPPVPEPQSGPTEPPPAVRPDAPLPPTVITAAPAAGAAAAPSVAVDAGLAPDGKR
jgi:predicted component of type VI protein secretion system